MIVALPLVIICVSAGIFFFFAGAAFLLASVFFVMAFSPFKLA